MTREKALGIMTELRDSLKSVKIARDKIKALEDDFNFDGDQEIEAIALETENLVYELFN